MTKRTINHKTRRTTHPTTRLRRPRDPARKAESTDTHAHLAEAARAVVTIVSCIPRILGASRNDVRLLVMTVALVTPVLPTNPRALAQVLRDSADALEALEASPQPEKPAEQRCR